MLNKLLGAVLAVLILYGMVQLYGQSQKSVGVQEARTVAAEAAVQAAVRTDKVLGKGAAEWAENRAVQAEDVHSALRNAAKAREVISHDETQTEAQNQGCTGFGSAGNVDAWLLEFNRAIQAGNRFSAGS